MASLKELVQGARGFSKLLDKKPEIVLGAGFGTGMVNTIPRDMVLVLAKEDTICMEVLIRNAPQTTFAVLAYELDGTGAPDVTKHHTIYVGSMFRDIDPLGNSITPKGQHTWPDDVKGTTSTHELLEKMKAEQLKFKFEAAPVEWVIKLRNAKPDGSTTATGSATKWNWVV